MDHKVFVAYDFEIGVALQDNLDTLQDRHPDHVRWPGTPDQGSIWKDVVKPNIDWCERLLAFVDLPNANVGFEIGYALGRGKDVSLARFSGEVPEWLRLPPFSGFMCPKLSKVTEIESNLIEETWIEPPERPSSDQEILFLCPPNSGESVHLKFPEAWSKIDSATWDLHDLPQILDGVGKVVWIITAPPGEANQRDGEENAALSVIAGYVLGIGLELEIYERADSQREVVDIQSFCKKYDNARNLLKHLEASVIAWENAQKAGESVEQPAEGHTLGPQRPYVAPHPEDNWADIIGKKFIGREGLLRDADDWVEGLLSRGRGNGAGETSKPVSLAWVSGFGGMGKSWFLHRVRLTAQEKNPNVCSLIIDWDKQEWRAPLTKEPRHPSEIFEVMATRLSQRVGVDAADPYWLALAEVRENSEAHLQLRKAFEAHLREALNEQCALLNPELQQVLDQESLWSDDVEVRKRNIDLVNKCPIRHQELLEAWIRSQNETRAAICNPNRVLVEGLQKAFREVMATRPVILLIDTAELLSEHLDYWLRVFLLPLVTHNYPILVLVGNRLRPDVGQPAGSRHGWLEEVPKERFRDLAFHETLRFTVGEMQEALERLEDPALGDVRALATQLHRITNGVPLAFQALLDLHAEGGTNLASFVDISDEYPLEENEAVRWVIGKVSDRLLMHLLNSPGREQDLRDIIALAILTEVDASVMEAVWEEPPRQRLIALGNRYSLLASGDLHPTVRNYLRRHWRIEDNRPSMFEQVHGDLASAFDRMDAPTDGPWGNLTLMRKWQRINLRSWSEGDDIVDSLAAFLAVSLAYEFQPNAVASLIAEVLVVEQVGDERHNVWRASQEEVPEREVQIAWLITMVNSSAWTNHDRACLDIVHGIGKASRWMDESKALALLDQLKNAVECFEDSEIPQSIAVGSAAFDLTGAFWGKDSENEYPNQTLMGYQLAIRCGLETATLFNNLGVLYKDYLKRYEESESSYKRAIELDAKFAYPHNGLGYLYLNLKRYEESESSYKRAIELDPKYKYPHNGLGNLYLSLKRYEESESSYKRAIELDPKYAYPHNGLGNLYQFYLKRYEESESNYERAIELDAKLAHPHNGLGLLYHFHHKDPSSSRQHYENALAIDGASAGALRGLAWLELRYGDSNQGRIYYDGVRETDPSHPNSELTGWGIQLWEDGWESLPSSFLTALKEMDPWWVSGTNGFLAAFFLKVRSQGHFEELLTALRSLDELPHWRPWITALEAWAGGHSVESIDETEAKMVFSYLLHLAGE